MQHHSDSAADRKLIAERLHAEQWTVERIAELALRLKGGIMRGHSISSPGGRGVFPKG